MTDPDHWYTHRHTLKPGQTYRLHDGDTVELDRRVPGDGTQWYVNTWTGTCWSCEDYTIEPGDIADAVPNPDTRGVA